MEETKFTPGPWTWINGDVYAGVGTEDAKLVAELPKDLRDYPIHAANGRLIASAPDLLRQRDELLAACQLFVDVWEKTHQFEKTDVAYRMARAAISNATTDDSHE